MAPFSRRTVALVSVALLATVLVVATHATGQLAGTSDDRLLAEVQGLRADVQRSSAITVRAHLLSSRLLLQESRINLLGSQLASVHRSIATFDTQRNKPLDSLKRAEEGIAEGLQGFDTAITAARAELARIDRESQTVRDSEQRLLNQLNAEQQRWAELNRLLEELERSAAQAGR